MHAGDIDGIEWFLSLLKRKDELTLHSKEIGDEVGTVKIVKGDK